MMLMSSKPPTSYSLARKEHSPKKEHALTKAKAQQSKALTSPEKQLFILKLWSQALRTRRTRSRYKQPK